MESKKIINSSKENSEVQDDGKEKALTVTFSDSVKAMDTSRDIANPAVTKLLLEMNEDKEKENTILKQNNNKLSNEISELKISEAVLKEKIKNNNKITTIESIFSILMGISVTTCVTISDEVFPKIYSGLLFLFSLFLYLYCKLKKD